MTPTHVVLREFSGADGVRFRSRQQIDASRWPNASALIRAHYIRERTVSEAAREQSPAPSTRPIRQKG